MEKFLGMIRYFGRGNSFLAIAETAVCIAFHVGGTIAKLTVCVVSNGNWHVKLSFLGTKVENSMQNEIQLKKISVNQKTHTHTLSLSLSLSLSLWIINFSLTMQFKYKFIIFKETIDPKSSGRF